MQQDLLLIAPLRCANPENDLAEIMRALANWAEDRSLLSLGSGTERCAVAVTREAPVNDLLGHLCAVQGPASWRMALQHAGIPALALHLEIEPHSQQPIEGLRRLLVLRSGISFGEITLEPARAEEREPESPSIQALNLLFQREIKQRQHVEKALRESQEMLLALAENANAIIGIVQVDRFVYVNACLVRLSGYTREELLTMPLAHLIHPDFRNMVIDRARRRQLGEKGLPVRYEFKIVGRGGKEVWLDFAPAKIEFRGKPAIIGIAIDITEHKQFEDALRKRESDLRRLNVTLEERVAERTAAAEEQARRLRDLARRMAHMERRARERVAQMLHGKLQPLLVAARLQTEVLERTQQVDGSAVKESINQAMSALRSLAVDFFASALMKAGLAEALRQLSDWVSDKHGLKLHLNLAPDPQQPEPDIRSLLFEGTRELLLNVIKHAGVKEANLELSFPTSDRVRVVVEDEGKGFIYDPGAPISGEPSSFGLLMLRQRIDLVGGTLEVQSAPGRGTRVVMEAPIAQRATKQAAPETPAPATAATKIRVLLVDDHRMVRQGVISLLHSDPGIEVVSEAADGVSALEMARAEHPDVILMDASMPKMDGVEATRRIVSEMPDIRVIGLSMHTDDELGDTMRNCGVESFVSKGDAPERLIEAIHARERATM